jgi:hypothetical protein
VSVNLISSKSRSIRPGGGLDRFRPAGGERHRLARQDRLAAHLAELHGIRALLAESATVVGSGWVQHGWFSVVDEHDRACVVTAHNLHHLTGRPVSGACLVGAIVHAAGGPAATRTQLVQRSLDLTWHTLHEDSHRPVRWCPAPDIRAAHVRDLTRWNDHRDRTRDEVTALLHAAMDTTVVQAELLRAATGDSPRPPARS